ncbi:FAD-dependent monooxygenase [Lentzea jiangxiensis]|uniref:2-polyprenyl-6-methoxyphenol hydroxylase n=1 Tax=Lentzea jiangxiensis TaxID=641025 RepID=A0A1H0K2H0_9PSEU|nr:FAD-dependent monooxygenase [Lentzea jiangxiensis]SDO50064.1 2-polyprenyl-6-methoxyphenol hydroxylase [Lentzea jiangxiensis]
MTSPEDTRRALVVGLGISGISSAIALKKAGWTPVVIEKAPGRRRGGYFIGLFGVGRNAAQRLGISHGLEDRTPANRITYQLDRKGTKRPAMGFSDQPGGPALMVRGDVEQAAFAALDPDVEIRYSTVPVVIHQHARGVEVTTRNVVDGTEHTERFELVIGADGLRSTVRKLVFGPDEDYLRRLNYMIAAYQLPGVLPGLAQGEGATLAEPGRSFWLFPFADQPPAVLFSYRTTDVDAEFAVPAAQRIREVYGPEPLGPTLEQAVRFLEDTDQYLFDSVEQVHLDSWHRGRVVLVGDSAWCVTLYAGMGVSNGIAGAELLGTMLTRYPEDPGRALIEWEKTTRPYVEYFQAFATRGRLLFTPANRPETVLRSAMLRLARSPLAGTVQRLVGVNGKAFTMRNADLEQAARLIER